MVVDVRQTRIIDTEILEHAGTPATVPSPHLAKTKVCAETGMGRTCQQSDGIGIAARKIRPISLIIKITYQESRYSKDAI